MSRSNYDKPFYVDVGTSVAAIRCASNHDVVDSLDHNGSKHAVKIVEETCERMNREFVLYAKLKAESTQPKSEWSVKDALVFASALANHGWTQEANADAASSCIYALCRMIKDGGNSAAAKRNKEPSTSQAREEGDSDNPECLKKDNGDIVPQSESVGNMATMREALEAYVEYSELALQMGMFTHDRLVAITAKARDALSAPPRNYDRFNSVKDAAIAFARERQDAPYPCPDFTFSAWLFATATEQKGENNGK